MNTKTILATVAGSLYTFFAGWVLFGMLLSNFYIANTKQYEGLSKGDIPNLLFIFLSGVFSTYLVTYVIRKADQGYSFATGFKHGLTVYFCMAAWVNLSIYSFYNLMNLKLVISDIFIQAIFGGINGGIIALVLGSGKKE
jgi:hypothetical protein